MRLLKKSKTLEKHKRRYLKLSVVIFSLVFIFHVWNLATGWNLSLSEIDTSLSFGFLAAFISGAMAFMGGFYLYKK